MPGVHPARRARLGKALGGQRDAPGLGIRKPFDRY
jgi:hypothetical protein